MNIEEKVRNLVENEINKAGYVLDEVVFEKKDTNDLVIVIDKEGVITIDDCIIVNNIVNPILDEADLIKSSYVLDVCSKEKGEN